MRRIGTGNKNRRPASGGRLVFPNGELLFTSFRGSHLRFVFHPHGTLASPLPGCRVHFYRTTPDVSQRSKFGLSRQGQHSGRPLEQAMEAFQEPRFWEFLLVSAHV